MAQVKDKVGLWHVYTKLGDDYEHRIQGHPYADSGFLRADLEGGKGCVAYAMGEVFSWELALDE